MRSLFCFRERCCSALAVRCRSLCPVQSVAYVAHSGLQDQQTRAQGSDLFAMKLGWGQSGGKRATVRKLEILDIRFHG